MRKLLVALLIMLITGCSSKSLKRPADNYPRNTQPARSTFVKHAEMGDRAFAAGNYQKAITHYSDWLAKNSKDVEVYFQRGRSYNKLKEYQLALEDFTHAANLAPEDLRFPVYRSGVLTKLERDKEARIALDMVMNNPRFSSIDPYARFLAYYLDGEMRNRSADYENASKSLSEANKVCALYPGAFSDARSIQRLVLYQLSVAYYQLSQPEQAVQNMEKYIELTKQAGEEVADKDYQSLALALYQMQSFERCKQILSQMSSQSREELGVAFQDPAFFSQQ